MYAWRSLLKKEKFSWGIGSLFALIFLKFTMASKWRRKTKKFGRSTLLEYISRYIKLYIFTNACNFYIILYTIIFITVTYANVVFLHFT